jgi:CarD family transcriptional regulator
MLKVGEVAVYPGHGVGKIERIEEKEISGTKKSFYIMRILDSDMTIMIPTDGTANAGLRYVISSREVVKVYEILKDKNTNHDTSLEQAIQRLHGEDKSGSIFEIATVLRELYTLRTWKELSFGERKMFETARNLIKKELSIALRKNEDDIVTDIEKIFSNNSRG